MLPLPFLLPFVVILAPPSTLPHSQYHKELPQVRALTTCIVLLSIIKQKLPVSPKIAGKLIGQMWRGTVERTLSLARKPGTLLHPLESHGQKLVKSSRKQPPPPCSMWHQKAVMFC